MTNKPKKKGVLRVPYSTLFLLDEVCEQYGLNRQQTLAVILNKKMKEIK